MFLFLQQSPFYIHFTSLCIAHDWDTFFYRFPTETHFSNERCLISQKVYYLVKKKVSFATYISITSAVINFFYARYERYDCAIAT